MATMKIKVGDNVRVIAGKDKGHEGKVQRIDHKTGRLIVEGANIITKHNKQNAQDPNGGIIHKEAPIDASNVMLLVNGKTTRVGFKFVDGKKVRYAKTDGSVID
jgi:large subunit ribosomal protein L24